MVSLQENVVLAPYTSIGLGGPARFFVTCVSVADCIEAITYAREHDIAFHVLGGGSNTIFSDEGFSGLVIHMKLTGSTYEDMEDVMEVTVAAGEVWDAFVLDTITRGLGGLECLSGIPGLVGATPMQNVGAYGQEVAQTITKVHVLDTNTLQEKDLTASECAFTYRSSMLKTDVQHRYVVLGVTFALEKNAAPTIAYEQVAALYSERYPDQDTVRGTKALMQVRDLVLELRRKKSMILDNNDPNSRSCGSFFINPIVSPDVVRALEEKIGTTIPAFPAVDGVKISAAWLIEQAGFGRGFRLRSAGVSENHTLALVNHGGTTVELLELAETIKKGVQELFGISLEQEPVVIPASSFRSSSRGA